MTKTLTYVAIIFCALFSSQTAFADVKIKSRQTMSGQSYENTTYIKGKRQRSETMNGTMVSITQCDLRRGLQINPNSKTYMVNPFDTTTTETTTRPATVDKNGVVQAGGTITTTITTKDTGERKQMFGYTARHLIITMEMNSSPDACNKTKMKMETDGWYIDFEPQFDCGDTAGYASYKNYKASGCQDKSVMKTVGTAKRGYPVYEKMTMFDENGKESMSYVNEVVELSKATLEASLFDIPQGYTEVSDASQMYASMSAASNMAAAMSDDDAPAKSGSIVSNASNAAATTNSAIGPKRAGTIRIGLTGVKTGAVGEGLTASDLAIAVQNTLVNYLKVPNVEVVALDAKLASAIDGEAKQKECDFVIHATVSHKKGGGGFGMFKAIAPMLSSVAPVAGAGGSVAGHVAGTVASQAIITAANVSGNIKSKDELTLDLNLNKVDGTSVLAKAYKVKAKSNGEDVISAAVEQAAQGIVTTIGR